MAQSRVSTSSAPRSLVIRQKFLRHLGGVKRRHEAQVAVKSNEMRKLESTNSLLRTKFRDHMQAISSINPQASAPREGLARVEVGVRHLEKLSQEVNRVNERLLVVTTEVNQARADVARVTRQEERVSSDVEKLSTSIVNKQEYKIEGDDGVEDSTISSTTPTSSATGTNGPGALEQSPVAGSHLQELSPAVETTAVVQKLVRLLDDRSRQSGTLNIAHTLKCGSKVVVSVQQIRAGELNVTLATSSRELRRREAELKDRIASVCSGSSLKLKSFTLEGRA